ncbi:MAG: pyrroloquinoline quinone precursor peptide PqqA [Tistrella sp.]|nr:pyrroloquinoline quinone precursor peptide PqqA [Tistrella sp.]MBA75030.1 pyrroloquinoline quinone precursor peptide PqqA [Tistrella sp.]HAE48482.1 pyrroloquinoline quinone precursor peptide PqqA [Tistrella mobilis]
MAAPYGVGWATHLSRRSCIMNWTTPQIVETRIGMEINGYMPADFITPEDATDAETTGAEG